jgi:hypothetical protein
MNDIAQFSIILFEMDFTWIFVHVRNYCTPFTRRDALTNFIWEWNYYVVVF